MKKNRIVHRGARIGDMRHLILVHDRAISSPVFGSVDFGEDFEGVPAWAAIKTSTGKIAMDEVGQDVNVTHELFVRFDSNIDSQTFIQVADGRRFRLLGVENYEERSEYMHLLATDRGLDEAAQA